MQPDFLCIGAQKAGTSWLYENLKSHPEIWLPPIKEIHYFNNFRNPDFRSLKTIISNRQFKRRFKNDLKRLDLNGFLWDLHYFFGKRDDQWYRELFKPPAGTLSGDITPAYSTLDSDVVRHVYNLLPDAKIIFILRDPIERAWSHAKMDVGLRFEPFRQANGDINAISNSNFIEHFKGRASLLRGDYLTTINNWLAHYPKEQVFIAFHDEILTQPEELVVKVSEFLDLSPNKHTELNNAKKIVNKGKDIDINKELHTCLANLYYEKLCALSDFFKKDEVPYPDAWKNKAKTILNAPS